MRGGGYRGRREDVFHNEFRSNICGRALGAVSSARARSGGAAPGPPAPARWARARRAACRPRREPTARGRTSAPAGCRRRQCRRPRRPLLLHQLIFTPH